MHISYLYFCGYKDKRKYLLKCFICSLMYIRLWMTSKVQEEFRKKFNTVSTWWSSNVTILFFFCVGDLSSVNELTTSTSFNLMKKMQTIYCFKVMMWVAGYVFSSLMSWMSLFTHLSNIQWSRYNCIPYLDLIFFSVFKERPLKNLRTSGRRTKICNNLLQSI